MTSPRRIVLGLIALLLLASAPPTLARGGAEVEESFSSTPVSFTMEPGPDGCAQLSSAITAEGILESHLRTTTYPDGSRRIVDDSVAKGRAVDAEGKSYRFRYENLAILTVPASGPLVIVEMTDSFVLKGQGQLNRVDAGFHWIWTYQPADPADPYASLVYPPVDNWAQLETTGDPLSCDPI